jgi:ABC-type multidrug transport system permease subunit
MRNVWTLTRVRMRLARRNRAFLFFSVVMPLAFLFLYASVFAKGEPHAVGYLLPAVLALTVMGSFWGLSVQLVMFREQGILRRFRLAPVGAGAMLASSIVSNCLLTAPTLAVELLLARWVYHVPSFGNLWGVVVLVTLGTMTFAALGLIVASVTNTVQETQVINNAIWFLFLFLSGATIPFPFLPGWVQRVGLFLPATHLITGLQHVLLAAEPLRKVFEEMVSLAGGLLLAFYVSLKLFRWEPEEKVTRQAKLLAVAAVIPFLLLGAWENTRGERRREAQRIYEMMQRQMPAPAPER